MAVDASDWCKTVCEWLSDGVLGPEDEVHLIGVKYVIPSGMAPMPAMLTGNMTAAAEGYAHAVMEEDARLDILLAELAQVVKKQGNANSIHTHALEPMGGASGVGESVTSWCKKNNPTMLVLGSRGMGAAKSSLMSLLGLGSVSSYCVHNSPVPVCVIKQHSEGHVTRKRHGEGKKVMVAVDDSEASKKALEWTVKYLLGEQDELHLVAVALPIPYDVRVRGCVCERERKKEVGWREGGGGEKI